MVQVLSGRTKSVWQLEGECNTHPQHESVTLSLPLAVESSRDELVGCVWRCNNPKTQPAAAKDVFLRADVAILSFL